MSFDIRAEEREEAISNDAIIAVELATILRVSQKYIQTEVPTLFDRITMRGDIGSGLITDQPKVAFQSLGFHQTRFAVPGSLPPADPINHIFFTMAVEGPIKRFKRGCIIPYTIA